ncbi:MAG: prephenate dehydrogenase/arogenate dehydrogenase family protein [Candidatus Omnitrophota bacterium]|jgi:prephenate dehydrogenase|nr:MAG: prephenate dehydrogenase/arogenate dehydrogenase family protein [Candidatus Omnitrophota bacterium]
MKKTGLVDSIRHIGIYGVGLLGGSLGMALKEVCPDMRITGIGRSMERLEEARRMGAIDSCTCDPAHIDPLLDALVICTPVRQVTEHLRQSLPSLKPNALVTDVGSTKALIVEHCEQAANGKARFVGSHPIAGSHKTGVRASSKDLYKKKVCIVTQTDHTCPEAFAAVSDLWKIVGMRVVRMSPTLHDRLTARSSHLPHLVAAALCHVVYNMGQEVQSVLGNGFRDSTRIAAGDPGMWLDISMDNQREILASIESLLFVLQNVRHWIEAEDEKALIHFLEQAQAWKKTT